MSETEMTDQVHEDPSLLDRRRRAYRLHKLGQTLELISKDVGVSTVQVWKDIKWCKQHAVGRRDAPARSGRNMRTGQGARGGGYLLRWRAVFQSAVTLCQGDDSGVGELVDVELRRRAEFAEAVQQVAQGRDAPRAIGSHDDHFANAAVFGLNKPEMAWG